MSFFQELKRRNVFRASAAYAIVGWLLTEIAAMAFGTFEAPVWVMKVFVTFVILGFPLAVFFAWAFELTPDGLKRERDVDRSQSITQATGRKLDFLIIAVLVGVVAYFAFGKFVFESETRPESVESAAEPANAEADKSIAVLPFVNMSDDAANEYFSDGISEEILNALAKVQDLKVSGRTSSFSFKDRDDDLQTIGKALGVSYILEGSVRKAGVRVRITAQLIKAEDGFHVWSEVYERELTDIFAIQDEIAQAILEQLILRLGAGDGELHFAAARTDVSAFDLYLEAKQKIYTRKKIQLEQAMDLLDEALDIDPEYSPAYAQRGIALLMLTEDQYGTIPREESTSRAKPMFDKALALNPASAEAFAGLGLYFSQKGNQERAVETLGKALSINPTLVNARNWLANAHARLNHLEDVKRIRVEILVRDPLYLAGINNLLDDYMLYGEIEQAQALLDRVRLYMPASRTIVSWTGVLHFAAGRSAESMPYFQSAYEMEPNNPGTKNQMTRALFYSGQYERLLEIGLDEFRVYGLMRVGRPDEALQLAKEMLAGRRVFVLFRVLIYQRRYAELIEYLESNWADLDAFEADHPERDGWSEHNHLGMIAYAYQRMGNEEKFQDALLRFAAALEYQRQIGANNQSIAFAEAVYAVLAGDHEIALIRLARAIEGGITFNPNLTDAWPMFAVLADNPGFQTTVQRMIDHMNSERTKLGLGPVYRQPVLAP
jgi:TolB-like protein/Tfp pilus assembly protein PilF